VSNTASWEGWLAPLVKHGGKPLFLTCSSSMVLRIAWVLKGPNVYRQPYRTRTALQRSAMVPSSNILLRWSRN
jgi:hypothetical protein